jgi:hypothetical protein
MLSKIYNYVASNNIALIDVPIFIEAIDEAPLPFGKNSKLAKTYNYASELHPSN